MIMDITGLLENIAGNSVVAGVLVWFMVQYQGLVKNLIDRFAENTTAINETKTALHDVRNAIQHCKAVDQLIELQDRRDGN